MYGILSVRCVSRKTCAFREVCSVGGSGILLEALVSPEVEALRETGTTRVLCKTFRHVESLAAGEGLDLAKKLYRTSTLAFVHDSEEPQPSRDLVDDNGKPVTSSAGRKKQP